MEGYCVKCRKKREMAEGKEISVKSRGGQRRAMKGKCPDCGTTMFKFLPSK